MILWFNVTFGIEVNFSLHTAACTDAGTPQHTQVNGACTKTYTFTRHFPLLGADRTTHTVSYKPAGML